MLFELRSALSDEDDPIVLDDIRNLLRALRRRTDTTVMTANEIDGLLEGGAPADADQSKTAPPPIHVSDMPVAESARGIRQGRSRRTTLIVAIGGRGRRPHCGARRVSRHDANVPTADRSPFGQRGGPVSVDAADHRQRGRTDRIRPRRCRVGDRQAIQRPRDSHVGCLCQ
jgi:hypothetical protein